MACMIKAGLCELDITPSLGGIIPGDFIVRTASSILDPLYVKALVLEKDDLRVAIVAADCLGIYDDATDKFRQRLKKRTGITHMIFAATHTHTGGPVQTWGDHLVKDEQYVDFLINKSVDAVEMSLQKIQPVTLRVGCEHEDGIAFNRRYIMKDGSILTNPGVGNPDVVKPAGPKDPDVTVMRIDDINGNVLGVLTSFSCHLDNVGSDKISADYAGELSRTLKSVYGPQAVSVFLTGACGNINQVDVSGKFPIGPGHYKKMGRILAGKAIAALEKASPMENDAFAVTQEIIECACRQPTAEDAQKGRELIASESHTQPQNAQQMEKKAWYYNLQRMFYAKEAVRMFENPVLSEKLDITVIRLGDLALVTVPAELFVEFALDIKKASPFPFTIVSTLSNGMVGYILTREALESGSYESRLASSAKMTADTGYDIVDTATKLLNTLSIS